MIPKTRSEKRKKKPRLYAGLLHLFEILEKAKIQSQKANQWLPEAVGKGENSLQKGHENTFREPFYILITMMNLQLLKFKWMHFIICKFHIQSHLKCGGGGNEKPEVLLTHVKWQAICSNMDVSRDYHIKWSETKVNIIWHHLYVESKINTTNELIYKTERRKNNKVVPLNWLFLNIFLSFGWKSNF